MPSYIILFLLSASISLALGNPLIKLLRSIGVEQTIREDGPQSHINTKSKTPTIGGIIFLIPLFLLTIILYVTKKEFQTLDLLVVSISTLLMVALGFIDDYLKILKKHNKGISGWTKLFIQLLLSFGIFKIYFNDTNLIFLIWCFFIIAGATNSYNLTDGLDGLLTSISLVSFLGFFVLFNYQSTPELSCFAVIFAGTLLGFLYFNKHPAKVFMGDIGSLAIGGAIGSLAIASRNELYLAFFAFIPIVEAVSVIFQVMVYKLTKRLSGEGKRLFKMAPIHHHFELNGWKETKIVQVFFLLQLAVTTIGIIYLLYH